MEPKREEGMPRHSGFTMLEALVALGLLAGVAAVSLQALLGGVHGARDAAYHVRATLLAEELITRARLVAPDQRSADLAEVDAGDVGTCQPPSVGDQARGDVVDADGWRAEVACQLPQAEVSVEAGADRIRVELRWQAPHRDEASSLELSGQLLEVGP
ncbi:hypothetical protein [Halorhodospira sp. 9621]|nr:hypothetical protein [Halorhodospira sp. 9621]